jgi:S-adenosylmethionine/arginine decarboxylase-like enzyme
MATRRQKRRASRQRQTRRRNYSAIQHHHLLLRMETRLCPGPADKAAAGALIHRIIHDIGMKPLDRPHVYYVTLPHYNEGLTAIMPIQTSHIAFHFWKQPEPAILKSRGSRCLLEFDIYTCGSLNSQQIQKVLRHLSVFGPTRVDATVINRKWSMTVDRHMHWSADDGEAWNHWVSRLAPK